MLDAAVRGGAPALETPPTRLEGFRLRIARVAWFITVPATLLVFAVALPARYAELRRAAVSDERLLVRAAAGRALAALLSPAVYPAMVLSLEILVMVACAAAALLIFWRRSDDRMAILASFCQVTYAALFLPTLDALARARPAWAPFVLFIQADGLASTLLIFYVSPSGYFIPRWTRPLAALWLAWTAASWLMPAAPFNLMHGRPHVATPSTFAPVWFLVCMAWYGTGLVAQVYRYRRVSTPLQRQQTKWTLIGWGAIIGVYAALVLPRITVPALGTPGMGDLLYRRVGVPVFEALLPLGPMAACFAMLRYRLWDVDLVVNRALVYALLTLAAGGTYVGSILALQGFLLAVTGQTSVAVVALSTLGSAALVRPLHRRLQGLVDRRFYRRHYDVARTIERFGLQIRDEVDLDRLTADLLDIVQEAVAPASVALWLAPAAFAVEVRERAGARRSSVAPPPHQSAAGLADMSPPAPVGFAVSCTSASS